MKRLVAPLFVGVITLHTTLAQSNEVYGQVGTEGIGIGYSYVLGALDNVRAELNGCSISHDFNSGGLHYDGKVNLAHGGIYGDFFLASNPVSFRLTAGVLIGTDNIDATANSLSGTYTINGIAYPTLGQSIHAKAIFPVLRPYLGIGLGHTLTAQKGFSMFFDAGVAYGKPHVDLEVPADILAEAGQASVDAEKRSLQNTVDRLRFYPVLKIGATYRF
ncbi:hypothetical protein DSC91_007353 [Paraburkholderia caffeinilytica]|uniref:Outer membrane protein beta-barrel domain-containing protein n=1 Tax=Paraburkholderia caffeinilytica TaxID=1761016 RepID=A0ABQ1LML9_9BURK|nr:hypothetical protein [Paraburkholderia caffeinilytica]AXL53751.1 hypothetical protein DSC91_007353 [Paraburkholderia caffeinilytica]GGC26090.1 hypothetical protein GCM10011400_10630 [Paraburkholderia caffeinilytica]CAB3807899.1 hypothetical protein LMG28690_06920 [Paraburkholderia caffeinilytica]